MVWQDEGTELSHFSFRSSGEHTTSRIAAKMGRNVRDKWRKKHFMTSVAAVKGGI